MGQNADLSITKVDDVDPVLAGNDVVYTVTVNNAGPDAASNVEVTDTVSAGGQPIFTSGCQQDPGGFPACDLGSIPAGGSAQFTLRVAVDPTASGSITNTASVSAFTNDPNALNNSVMESTSVEPAHVPTLGQATLLVLMLLLAFIGVSRLGAPESRSSKG